MELQGKRIAILVDNVYQEMEVWYPLFRFQEAGAEVVTLGSVAGHTYTSKLGYPVKCDVSYQDADPSICHGPWVLCSTGTLKGRNCTCFFAIKDDVMNAGGIYRDAEVVVDRNLVTSRKPEDLPAFCRESIKVLLGR